MQDPKRIKAKVAKVVAGPKENKSKSCRTQRIIKVAVKVAGPKGNKSKSCRTQIGKVAGPKENKSCRTQREKLQDPKRIKNVKVAKVAGTQRE